MDLTKPLHKMTRMELRMLIERKDEELLVLRNRLARYGEPVANAQQLSAARALMEEVIHERKA